jgi:hypothetical protein
MTLSSFLLRPRRLRLPFLWPVCVAGVCGEVCWWWGLMGGVQTLASVARGTVCACVYGMCMVYRMCMVYLPQTYACAWCICRMCIHHRYSCLGAPVR